MILNDEEIKDLGPREIIPGVDDYILILKDSHIEANAELRKATTLANSFFSNRLRKLFPAWLCRPSMLKISKAKFPSERSQI